MKKLINNLEEHRLIVNIILILLFTFIYMINMFKPTTNVLYDDGLEHLMRSYGTYKNILRTGDTNIISEFANGFGYSWNLFYGPISLYMIIIMGMITGSFNLGFKIALLFLLFFAGYFMHKLVYNITENYNTSLLAGIVYILSPYLFTDFYVRFAIGECLAFVFMPLVFLGLYNLFNTEENHYYLVFGISGLILSHNISTILVMIFVFLYIIIHPKQLFETKIKTGLLIDFLFIILITAFFTFPLLQTKSYTRYQIYVENAMSTEEDFLKRQISINELFLSKSNYIFEIGMPVIMMLVFSVVAFKRLEENNKDYLFFLISGIVSVLISTKIFPWKILPNSFYIIQFPWRILILSTFFFSIICSINMEKVINKFKLKDVIIISIICLIYIYSEVKYIPYLEHVSDVENYNDITITGQTDECIGGMGKLEYLPTKAFNDTFYIATRESGIIVQEGNCDITNQMKVGNYMTAKIVVYDEDCIIELPYIYYPGFTVKLDGMKLDTFETDNGFVGCKIDKYDKGIIEVKYTGTKVMNITKIISLISFIVFLVYVWKKH